MPSGWVAAAPRLPLTILSGMPGSSLRCRRPMQGITCASGLSPHVNDESPQSVYLITPCGL